MFSFLSRRTRYTRKKHQKSSSTSLVKMLLSTLLTVGITSGIIYAATLTTVMTQTISQGDTIGAGWYQSVNDRLINITLSGGLVSISGSIFATSPTASGQLATKGYVDSAIAGVSGGGPCAVNLPGMICSGNTIYAFRIGLTTNYMTTPGGCTDSPTPTCAGGNDTVSKTWGTYGVTTGRTSSSDGQGNSAYIAANYSDTYAAKFCEDMVYAGYSDWFLPSKDETLLLWQNRFVIGGFSSAYYWTSTESDSSNAIDQSLATLGDYNPLDKRSGGRVRCVRKF